MEQRLLSKTTDEIIYLCHKNRLDFNSCSSKEILVRHLLEKSNNHENIIISSIIEEMGNPLYDFFDDIRMIIQNLIHQIPTLEFDEMPDSYGDGNKIILYKHKDYKTRLSGDYCVLEFKGSDLFITFSYIIYDGPCEGWATINNLDKMSKIANYGASRFQNDAKAAFKTMKIGDLYSLFLKNVSCSFDHPESPFFSFDSYDYDCMAFITSLHFDRVDEEEYQIGGKKYEEGKKRWDSFSQLNIL